MSDTIIVPAAEISDYIPQKPPIVMIGDLVVFSQEKTVTRLVIDPSNIFVKDGLLTEPGLIENIAQTIAVRVGYYYFTIKKQPPTGFIGAIRRLEVSRLPKVGEVIYTEIQVIQEIFGVTMVNGLVRMGDQVIASCEMKTVLEKDADTDATVQ